MTRTAATENFPVASRLIAPRHRPAIMAFYRFARTADDIADDAAVDPAARLARLRTMRATLAGEGGEPTALGLRATQRRLGINDVHARDLLAAFERDVTTPRTPDFAALLDYCRLSAMPVGRFVLDVHGEDRATWGASDALCAALQIINHLQDCGGDFRDMGRVYIPDVMLAAAGLDVDVLAALRSPPALLGVIRALADECAMLLRRSAPFARAIRDRRLALEVAVIQRLAEDLVGQLRVRDPLAERIAHSKPRAAWLALGAIVRRA